MKRFVLACLLSSLALLTAAAVHAAGLEWGIKVGVTAATLNGGIRDATDPKSTADVTGGLMLALPLPGGLFAVQGEALFVTKGADIPRTGGSDKVRLRDVEFPVLARLTFPTGLPVKPFVVAGPSFGYNIDATIDPADPALPKTDLSGVRKLDTSFAVGAGARCSVIGLGLTLEGRYTSSLSDVQKDVSNALPAHNAVYTFMVGLVF